MKDYTSLRVIRELLRLMLIIVRFFKMRIKEFQVSNG